MIGFSSEVWFLITTTVYMAMSHEAQNYTNEDELVFAHVIFRHGNRTIYGGYKTDPYKNASYWPEGFGHLTNIGKRTQYELGNYLRRRYGKRLDIEYSQSKVYIRSTDVDRTLMSAMCNAAGLFPPHGDQVWTNDMNWQPIPIHTIPLDDDYLLYQATKCDKFDKILNDYFRSNEIKALLEKYSGFGAYLQEKSGKSIRTLADFYSLYDVLKIEYLQGFDLPEWAKNILHSTGNEFEHLAIVYTKAITHTTEMKKLRAGFLIKEIFDRFKKKMQSVLKPDRSLWIYSAHDNTIINVLNALNVFQFDEPPFAASIHFELYKHEEEYYVQLFYRSDNSEYLPPISIPNCGTKCSLDKLYKLYKDILPNENETFESMCRLSP